MKKGYSHNFPGSKLYFTEADSSSQDHYRITAGAFNVKMKLWLLLADHVILSTAHMLQSSITFDWLNQNKEILSAMREQNAILPSLREDRANFTEYILQAPHEEDKPSLIREQKDNLLRRAQLLQEIFDTTIGWSAVSESRRFRSLFARDLMDQNSALRRKIRSLEKKTIYALAKDIDHCEYFNRESLMQFIRKHCPKHEKPLVCYGDIFYYLSGALHKNAFPVFHPFAANLCKEQIAQEVDHIDDPILNRNDLWHRVMDAWGITYTSIERLPLSEIYSIRHDSVGRRVRETWATLLNKARNAEIHTQENIAEFIEAKNKLIELFNEEIDTQRHAFNKTQRAKNLLDIGSWMTGGLSTAVGYLLTENPVGSLIVGIFGMLTGSPIIKSIEKKIPKTELVILADRIHHIA